MPSLQSLRVRHWEVFGSWNGVGPGWSLMLMYSGFARVNGWRRVTGMKMCLACITRGYLYDRCDVVGVQCRRTCQVTTQSSRSEGLSESRRRGRISSLTFIATRSTPLTSFMAMCYDILYTITCRAYSATHQGPRDKYIPRSRQIMYLDGALSV